MSNERIKVGITQGDINGIGYEIILKSLSDPSMLDLCTPIIYGSSKVAAYHRKALDLPSINFNNIRTGEEAHPKRINMVNCLDDSVRVELGKATEAGGEAACKAIERAITDLKKGAIHVLVTAPVNKKMIQSERFEFPGHTEYLANTFDGESLMLMVSNELRVGVVTGHIPLKYVSSAITRERILGKIRILNNALKIDFNIRTPRIAVLGLNPHASDDGLFGSEENEIIIPALEDARREKIMAFGPYAADGLFGSFQSRRFDAILAMYHDQGLTPFKTLAFDTGVNYTAGLSIVRTSPDHGTAFEIAGRNEAHSESFLSAIFLAIDIYKNRKQYQEISANPMKAFDASILGSDDE